MRIAAFLISLFLLFGCLGSDLKDKDIGELGDLNIPVECNASLKANQTVNNGTAYVLGRDYLLDFEEGWIREPDDVRVYRTGSFDFIVEGDELVYYRWNDREVSTLSEFVTGCKGFMSEGQQAREVIAALEAGLELSNCSKGDFGPEKFDIGKEDYCTGEEMEEAVIGLGFEGLVSALENYTEQ